MDYSNQKGEFNLNIPDRAGSLFPNLPGYAPNLVTVLAPGAPGPVVSMSYHHIISSANILDLWNWAISQTILGPRSTKPDPKYFAYISHLISALDARFRDLRQVLGQHQCDSIGNIISSLKNHHVVHNPNTLNRMEGWDDFIRFLNYPPGVTFVGPSGNFRTDDPGPDVNAFEKCDKILTDDKYKRMKNAHTKILARDHNKPDTMKAAIVALSEAISSAPVLYYPLKPSAWVAGSRAGTYKLA